MWPKNNTLFLRYTLCICTVLLAVQACNEKPVQQHKPKKTKTPQKIAVQPLVSPPLKGINTTIETFTVDADSSKTWYAGNGFGTRVTIPAASFVDAQHKPLTGKINITYRELHTLNDILIAGIPLNYDAAGMLKRLNTAGTIEIRAYQNNQAVYLDSGKTIHVNTASFEPGAAYHAFYLDEHKTRNWHYIKDLDATDNPEKKRIVKKAKQKVKEFDLPLNGGYFAFNYMALLDVYLNDKTVEIKKMRNDLTLQGKIKEYGVTWTNIFCFQSVEYMGNKYLASLLLWQKLNPEPWPVWAPTAICNISPSANGTFTVELSQAKGKGLYKATIKPFFPIKSLLAFSPSYWKNKYAMALRKAINDEMQKHQLANVYRTLEVHTFGIYTMGKLQHEEDYIQIKLEPHIEDQNTPNTGEAEVFYISERYRTVLRFPYKQWGNITLLPDTEAVLFMVLPGNKVAMVSREDMRKIDFTALKKHPQTPVKLSFKTANSPLTNPQETAHTLGIPDTPM